VDDGGGIAIIFGGRHDAEFAVASTARWVSVVIKVPMDESGIHDSSPVLTVAAYVARREQWQDWTKR
jgi:hypothetical protein